MNKFWLLGLLLVLLLTACGVEDDDDDVEDIRLMHRNTDDVEEGKIDSSKLYDLALTADDTEYTLSGELNDIKITGDRNTVSFTEDIEFDKLVITGTGNRVNTPENEDITTSVTAKVVIVTQSGNFYNGVTAQTTPVTSFATVTETVDSE